MPRWQASNKWRHVHRELDRGQLWTWSLHGRSGGQFESAEAAAADLCKKLSIPTGALREGSVGKKCGVRRDSTLIKTQRGKVRIMWHSARLGCWHRFGENAHAYQMDAMAVADSLRKLSSQDRAKLHYVSESSTVKRKKNCSGAVRRYLHVAFHKAKQASR